MPAERLVSALPARRTRSRPVQPPARALQTAREWQALLESGEAKTRAEIARRESVTRARVTQVMGLLRLAPSIQKHVLAMPATTGLPEVSVRALRAMSVSAGVTQVAALA